MLKKIPALRSLQSSLGRLAASLPVSPNQITCFSLLLALIAFFFASQGQPLFSLLFFVLAGAADALDGAVARARKQVSARGAYIDGIIDRLVEFLFVLSFAFYALPAFVLPAALSLVLILFLGSAMTSFAVAYADHRKIANPAKIARVPGILPRAERLILLFAALAFVPFSPAASSVMLACAAVLSFMTFLQRFLYFAS
jgi:phosphatidylglycerophosphate synthase